MNYLLKNGDAHLKNFGVQCCYLSNKKSIILYQECQSALELAIDKLELYIKTNIEFEEIGRKMLDSWRLSRDQKTYKEIPVEITRNWSKS